ncbi:MAG: hypothetical protein IPO17_16685 [Flavobacteriales bacterium]|nr:hypothetical protein [Flavobacteriales bacterium]
MKLNELKIALVRQILHSEDADELRTVDGAQPRRTVRIEREGEGVELDKDSFADYKAGKGATTLGTR